MLRRDYKPHPSKPGVFIVLIVVPVVEIEDRKMPPGLERCHYPSVHHLVSEGAIGGWGLRGRTATHMLIQVEGSRTQLDAVLLRPEVSVF